jgi:hypothetical protein
MVTKTFSSFTNGDENKKQKKNYIISMFYQVINLFLEPLQERVDGVVKLGTFHPIQLRYFFMIHAEAQS